MLDLFLRMKGYIPNKINQNLHRQKKIGVTICSSFIVEKQSVYQKNIFEIPLGHLHRLPFLIL